MPQVGFRSLSRASWAAVPHISTLADDFLDVGKQTLMTLSVESCPVWMGRFRPVTSVLVRWVHGPSSAWSDTSAFFSAR